MHVHVAVECRHLVLDFFWRGACHIHHVEDDGGLLNGLIGALYADTLQLVVGLAYAGGVDEAEEGAVDVEGVLDGVAGGAGDVRHDGAFVLEQRVQQSRFAHIRLADDGHGDAAFQHVA